MLRSLRVRLVLLTVFVAGISLVTVALLSLRAVRTEYGRLERHDRAARLTGAAEMLSERARAPGGLEDASAELARIAAPLDQELLLVGPEDVVVAASSLALEGARVERGPAGEIAIIEEQRHGGTIQVRRTVLVGVAGEPVRGAGGALLGTLFPHPKLDEGPDDSAPRFVRSVNRWLLLSVIGAGALAVLVTLALSRRILGPVEALTAAARRMGAGDRSQRVEVRTKDEIGELSRAFNAMAESLERDETLRRNLVSDVAHELRTPLTNLRCQLEAVQDGLAPWPDTVRSLHEETLLLSRLVDDLQDLALAEAGRLPLRRGPVPLDEAVRLALGSIATRASERRIELRAQVPAGLLVDADRERLAQVLRNLLANAVMHTPSGGAITVEALGGGEGATIAVRDTGPGIPAEHLPHVFERFYRADPARARASGGAGLGLAIVKQLVSAHGGVVRVENAPGAGAVFTFTLPLARAS